MLKHRLITGPILVLALLGLAVFDQYVGTLELKTSLYFFWPMSSLGIEVVPKGLVLFVTCCLVIALASRELAAIARDCGMRCEAGIIFAFAAIALYAMWLGAAMPQDPKMAIGMLGTVLAAAFATSLVYYSRGKRTDGVLAATAGTTCLVVYLGVFLGFYMLIQVEHSIWWIIGLIAIVKMCDTGAYFTGCSIGRHKMIPWLSPGKTWEGLAGGLVTAMATAWGLSLASEAWLPGEPLVPLWLALLIGLVIGACGQIGDLAMSLLKRGADRKDSSNLLPGLGGIMDVLDSPLFVAPVGWWMLQLT